MGFSVHEVIRVSCLSRDVNKPTTRQTRHANDFVNAKSHARERTSARRLYFKETHLSFVKKAIL